MEEDATLRPIPRICASCCFFDLRTLVGHVRICHYKCEWECRRRHRRVGKMGKQDNVAKTGESQDLPICQDEAEFKVFAPPDEKSATSCYRHQP